ncbi:MAG: flagellar M-ring protein FliF [Methylococcaceae bacterium]|nr:flagellar M-ring protein FliF [Methylococcaceae bacterium]
MQENNTGKALAAQNSGRMPDHGHPAVRQLGKLPALRQIGVMAALAFSVAIGVAAVLWSRTPDYTLLYGSVADKDVPEVLAALENLDIDYKVESSSGAILVPDADVHEVRLKLAAQGLPKTESLGFELLQKQSEFGTSQSLEAARFHHALENEIARTVGSIQNVKSVRVHLALPKQSVFVRQQKKPSASILVNLYAGRSLEKSQVEAIVHLVASSVPQLEPGQVTVVDQRGRLLNSLERSDEISLSSKRFEYKTQVEEHLIERAENILSPLVGEDGLRIQATADIDFTTTERTEEQFNPDLPALRSEQTNEETNQSPGAQGIPGALSNQPPAAGTAPEQAAAAVSVEGDSSARNSAKSATRNYELDKTISHTRLAPGILRRLSVAVIIDDRAVAQDDGSVVKKPYSPEEIARFTDLVKQAVGFNVARGDQVTVSNSTFQAQQVPEALPDAPIWEQSWFKSLLKQLAAAAVVAFLIFGVLRPALRSLIGRDQAQLSRVPGTPALPAAAGSGASAAYAGVQAAAENEDKLLLEAPQSYEKRLEFARKMVDDDPKRVAQVLKNWIASDG